MRTYQKQHRKYAPHDYSSCPILSVFIIHEWVILPYNEEVGLEKYSELVKFVNLEEVSEVERLSDEAFLIKIE